MIISIEAVGMLKKFEKDFLLSIYEHNKSKVKKAKLEEQLQEARVTHEKKKLERKAGLIPLEEVKKARQAVPQIEYLVTLAEEEVKRCEERVCEVRIIFYNFREDIYGVEVWGWKKWKQRVA